MADFNDLTYADNPYDEDGVNLRLTPPDQNGGIVSDSITAGSILTQRLELPEDQLEEIIDSIKAHKNKGLPTQVVHPWRTVVRTMIQHFAGLIVAGLVWLLASIGVDVTTLEADLIISVTVLLTLAFSGAVARIMAHPRVEDFFVKYVSPLATGVADE